MFSFCQWRTLFYIFFFSPILNYDFTFETGLHLFNCIDIDMNSHWGNIHYELIVLPENKLELESVDTEIKHLDNWLIDW